MIGYVTKLLTHLSILQAVLPAETAIKLANKKIQNTYDLLLQKNRDFNQNIYKMQKAR